MAKLILKAPYYKQGHKTEDGRGRGGMVVYCYYNSRPFPDMFLLHHLVYGNTNKIGNYRKQKNVRIAKLPFPFRYSLRADPEELPKLALCKPVFPTVIQYTFAYSDLVLHFIRLYVS